ncbi:aromatic ring-hydroxylating dioxygenase subunit alpha [Aminobacter sp. AP02]|uniref:aromatic ring-hydroxylating oxygenase subunit alpha n=1 Tax=Aminobacter sp. AP02 TaxID=2135737 RepID=UPI000D795A4B|nr:aromatic ring-hydroxylating dioxygenase subunit alpha [Aminobacter sp. AP02]PWK66411.1 choline monooxygenase [Aminobacter sp. AP02]
MLKTNDHEFFGMDRFKPEDPAHSYTLPANLYFDQDVYEAEKEAVFYKSWNFVCHVSQLEAPGSYTTVKIGDQNIAIVRGRDGEIRAFHNVCSHRAHQLLTGEGKTRMIVCPYHAWTYELDGKLRTNAILETVDGFAAEEFCLKPVKAEIFLGFVWINLDLGATTLADQSGAFGDEVRKFVDTPETLKFAGRLTFEIKANWKNVVENFQECYHCPPAHPALVELFDHGIYRTKNYGICSSHIAPAREDNSAYKFDATKQGNQLMYAAWFLWPNVTFNVFPGRRNLSFMHIMPTGPETTFEHWDFFLDEATPNEEELAAMDYIKNILQPEDIGLVESVQRGLHSQAYSQGRLVIDKDMTSNSEHGIHHFQSMYFRAMTANRG